MSSFCGSNRAHNNLLLDGPPAEDEDALDSSGSGSSARLLQKYALVKMTEDALLFAEVYSLDGLVKRDAEYFLPFLQSLSSVRVSTTEVLLAFMKSNSPVVSSSNTMMNALAVVE